MKTKEEILKDKFRKSPDGNYNPIHEAMDEYAKEVAVAFAEWTNIRDYVYDTDNRTWWYNDSTPEYTTGELFDIFLSEQQAVKQ